MTDAAAAADVASPAPPRAATGMFSALAVPYYLPLWLAGSLFHICRWGVSFLGAYLAVRLSGSPRLVQLTGVALWSPLLIGGIVGGVISDRLDRRRTVLAQFVVLIPLTAAVGLAAVTDALRLWMIYPFLVVVGVGWVIDMTSRRALVFDLVGQGRIDNAMALESLSLSAGLALGTLAGGTAVAAIGIGPAFLAIAAILTVSLVLLAMIPRSALRPEAVPVPAAATGVTPSPLAALREGVGLMGRHRALLSILGVTACVNFFFFSFMPLVQVFGRRLEVGPAAVGLLASMTGIGMMIGSMLVARARPRRRGLVYVGGSAMAMVLLIPFALSPWYLASLALLLASSVGTGLFGSTQAALVMTVAPPEARGRALGLLSTAIGVLPLGMIALGELAERIGAPTAVIASTLTGFTVLVVWLAFRPEAARITT